MKHVFIVNPTSGRGAANKIIPLIEEYFENSNEEYEIRKTDCPGCAQKLASEYTTDSDVHLYACGGDGTLWEVINGLNDGVVMGVIPCGTGNDFFRMFKADSLDMKKLLKDTIEGEVVATDYGLCNDSIKFINCLGIGFDADINARVIAVGKDSMVPKKLIYMDSVLRMLTKLKTYKFSATTKGETVQREGLLVAIMNGKYYGGGFTPAPLASLTDGLLDVCMIKPVKLGRLLPLLPKYLKGTHTKESVADYTNTEEIELRFEEEVNVTLDGEPYRMNVIKAKVVKQGLMLKVPKGSNHEIRK